MDYGYSQFGPRTTFATYDLPFIACGAFSGLDDLLKAEKTAIGFQSKSERANDRDSAVKVVEEVEGFQKYGFLPELIGRFTRIVTFPPLTNETLSQILTDNILPQYQREFAGEGLQLVIAPEASEFVIGRCLKRGTGARGLHSELAHAIEQAAFETFGEEHSKEVTINVANGKLACEIA
jgi:ATP-dependent Clp protease ATP-binding subunit ClpX